MFTLSIDANGWNKQNNSTIQGKTWIEDKLLNDSPTVTKSLNDSLNTATVADKTCCHGFNKEVEVFLRDFAQNWHHSVTEAFFQTTYNTSSTY